MNYEDKYKQALERASKLRVQNLFDGDPVKEIDDIIDNLQK
jgi:hypothetical protein